MPGRHGAQPIGPGVRQAPPRLHPPRCGSVGAGLGRGTQPRSASASVSSPLCDITTRAAINFAAGQAAAGTVSASAAALAQEVLRSMLIHKLKLHPLSLAPRDRSPPAPDYLDSLPGDRGRAQENRSRPPQTRPASHEPQGPEPGRMFVVGRVLDPQGKPVPNATTMVYAAIKQPGRGDRLAPMAPTAIGQAQSDDSGRFRLDAARTSRRRSMSRSAPSPSRPAMAPAGSSSTPTPISPPPTSRSGPSR